MAEELDRPFETPLHALLRRQLRKAGLPERFPGDPADPWAKLLAHVNTAYLQADQDRYTLERSIAISSREMQELNRSLKQSQALLARERDRLHNILGSLRDVVWSAAADQSVLLYVNPAFQSVYGRAEADFHADPGLWMKMAHQEDAETVRNAFEKIRHGGFAETEYRVVKPAGEIRWIRHRLQMITSPEGRAARFDAICSDVTEKKRAELEILKAKEAAVAATRVKTQFLANMSHEVRTPLNGVMGMAQLLLDTPLSERQRQMAEVILESSHSLLAIIDDVLDISKIESGNLKIKQEPFDARRIMDEVVALLRPQAAAKGLRFLAQARGRLPLSVSGDPLRLKQVLVNLAGNGIKFTETGEVIMQAETLSETAEAVHLRFEIRDTGPGIPAAARDHLFRPFTQLDASTTRRHGGTGLGLFISRQLVELMDGEIGYEDPEGGGSRFWFTLKLKPVAAAAEPRRDASSASPASSGTGRGGPAARILLVEDNPVNQKVFLTMLEHLGHRCDFAVNGAEGLEALATRPYDLVFMDCQMPVMDGYEAARRVRATPALARNTLIAMTALAMPGDMEKCLEAGMDDYLGKPIALSRLRAMLDKWLPPAVNTANS